MHYMFSANFRWWNLACFKQSFQNSF